MRLLWIAIIIVVSSFTTTLLFDIQTGNASMKHCEKVILTGVLKLSKKTVSVETLACREFGDWHLPFNEK